MVEAQEVITGQLRKLLFRYRQWSNGHVRSCFPVGLSEDQVLRSCYTLCVSTQALGMLNQWDIKGCSPESITCWKWVGSRGTEFWGAIPITSGPKAWFLPRASITSLVTGLFQTEEVVVLTWDGHQTGLSFTVALYLHTCPCAEEMQSICSSFVLSKAK